ncbi:MAG TPA: recombinase family protein [Clostridiales bacterium]|jgi:DNA invertase Pin-like site-specific DNA recombinase/regulator of replication initiation timing|nr:recombinase family protein [Clostridiales bacterium]
MVAIYARQSVDKADSISIESQIEYCLHETRGEEYRVYQDRGFSGKNTERPQFQRMMDDISNNEISRVIVYKLDRISRSILDFSKMMEVFTRHKVEFVSTTEKFDTSTPMGRAMLNICIVFAQLERETIQMRVEDAYASRSMKGYYMGGRIPYGFMKETAVIDGIKTAKYTAKEDEAEQIRLIYSLYSRQGWTVSNIVRYLDTNNIRKTRGGWNSARITELLKNPVYVRADIDVYNFFKVRGTEIINEPCDFAGIRGCYLYSIKGSSRTRKDMSDYGNLRLVIAPHEGIVDSETWLKCRLKAENNRSIPNGKRASHSWLIRLKCIKCGYALRFVRWIGKSKTNEYYVCSRRSLTNKCEGIGAVRQALLEDNVLEIMARHYSGLELKKREESEQPDKIVQGIKQRITQKEAEIKSLLSKVSQANETLMKYMNEEIERLDMELKELSKSLSEARSQRGKKSALPAASCELGHYFKRWERISFEDKRAVAELLIERIYVGKLDGETIIEPVFYL